MNEIPGTFVITPKNDTERHGMTWKGGAALIATVPAVALAAALLIPVPASADSLPAHSSDASQEGAQIAGWEGPSYNAKPRTGDGRTGANLYDAAGNWIGKLGERDQAFFLGCHKNDGTRAYIQQYTSGTNSGGVGAYKGFAEMDEIENLANRSEPLPCGG